MQFKDHEQHRAIEDWNDIQCTLIVAQSGSYHAAAARLGLHETTVSRRVQRLERELGTKLFLRRSHGMTLTPAGESLMAKASAMEQAAISVRSEIAGMDAQMTGVLRISISEGLGTYWLTPVLKEFQQQYTELSFDVITSTQQATVLAAEVDVAITIVRPKEPRVVAVRVGDIRYSLFASRKYIRQYGSPQTAQELYEHKLVDLYLFKTDSHLKWWTDITWSSRPRVFRSNATGLFLSAIQEGFGIGMAPSFYKFLAPDLVTLSVVPDCHAELWLAWHAATKARVRIRTLTNFLRSRFTLDRANWFS
jgi:DNA-binding transcriptional LysR family regulator